MKKGYLLFLGAGKEQESALIKAKEMNIKTIAIDGNKYSSGFNYSDLSVNIDFFKSPEMVIKYIDQNSIKLDGVLSFCTDKGVALAGRIRDKYNLYGDGYEICKQMVNKVQQRLTWTKNKIPCPKWDKIEKQKTTSLTDFSNFSFPIIVKPSESSGSRGITVVKAKSEIKLAIKKALSNSFNGEIIIEEFFDGDEYTIESFSNNGDISILAITKKSKVSAVQQTVANQLESINNKDFIFIELANLTKDALNALGYKNGPAHTEILYNKNTGGKILVETAARGGGFKVFESLVPRVSGLDVTRLVISQALGESIDYFNIKNNYGILRFFTGKSGIVSSIEGFEKIKDVKNIYLEGSPFLKVGDKISNPNTDGDRLGYLLGSGPSREEVINCFDEIFKAVNFKID